MQKKKKAHCVSGCEMGKQRQVIKTSSWSKSIRTTPNFLCENCKSNFSSWCFEAPGVMLWTAQTRSASLLQINPSIYVPQKVLDDAISLST